MVSVMICLWRVVKIELVGMYRFDEMDFAMLGLMAIKFWRIWFGFRC